MGLLLHVVAGVVPDVELQALYVVLDLAGVAVGAAVPGTVVGGRQV